MARPPAERRGGEGARSGAGLRGSGHRIGAPPLGASPPAWPLLPSGRHPSPPGPRGPADSRPRAEPPCRLPRAWRGDPGGDLGARDGDAQRGKARSCVRAGCPRSAGTRGAHAPRPGEAAAPGPPRGSPSISVGPEHGGRGCWRFGLGWKVGDGVRGSGPPNVDYLVRVSRAQKTHDLVSVLGLIHSSWQSGRCTRR